MSAPPPEGESLPSSDSILRLSMYPKPKDFAKTKKAEPTSFVLSTAEKNQPPFRLSVFSESRTTPQQARYVVNKEKLYLCLRLDVDFVRSLDSEMDVVWHRIDDPSPGAEGHAGITGLGPDIDSVKAKRLRALLAEAAEAHLFKCVPASAEAV